MDFKVKNTEELRTVKCAIASATVIEAGDLVALSSGLIIKATAASTAIGYAPNGSADGETEIDVTEGNDFTLQGTADAVFAATHRGTEVDIVVTDGVQYIDVGSSSKDVLKVGISKNAGTVDSANNVEVRINKPLF
jgi:predicted transcriptional regulator